MRMQTALSDFERGRVHVVPWRLNACGAFRLFRSLNGQKPPGAGKLLLLHRRVLVVLNLRRGNVEAQAPASIARSAPQGLWECSWACLLYVPPSSLIY